MQNINLTQEIINKVKIESIPMLIDFMGEDLLEIWLYGSCSRGDFCADSDIDIALLTQCDRLEAKKYNDRLADVATDFAMRYLAVVNFICLPQAEFEEKKSWYPYFKNINTEGEMIYGRQNIC